MSKLKQLANRDGNKIESFAYTNTSEIVKNLELNPSELDENGWTEVDMDAAPDQASRYEITKWDGENYVKSEGGVKEARNLLSSNGWLAETQNPILAFMKVGDFIFADEAFARIEKILRIKM